MINLSKKDPVADAVLGVMKRNQLHREVERALNEELQIENINALPYSDRDEYNAALEASFKLSLNEGAITLDEISKRLATKYVKKVAASHPDDEKMDHRAKGLKLAQKNLTRNEEVEELDEKHTQFQAKQAAIYHEKKRADARKAGNTRREFQHNDAFVLARRMGADYKGQKFEEEAEELDEKHTSKIQTKQAAEYHRDRSDRELRASSDPNDNPHLHLRRAGQHSKAARVADNLSKSFDAHADLASRMAKLKKEGAEELDEKHTKFQAKQAAEYHRNHAADEGRKAIRSSFAYRRDVEGERDEDMHIRKFNKHHKAAAIADRLAREEVEDLQEVSFKRMHLRAKALKPWEKKSYADEDERRAQRNLAKEKKEKEEKKEVKEDTINEISKDAAYSYMARSIPDLMGRRVSRKDKAGPDAPRKMKNRETGLSRAVRRVEKLDELSKGVLDRYMDKAVPDMEAQRDKAYTKKWTARKIKADPDAARKMNNRATGISLAFKKKETAPEEVPHEKKELPKAKEMVKKHRRHRRHKRAVRKESFDSVMEEVRYNINERATWAIENDQINEFLASLSESQMDFLDEDVAEYLSSYLEERAGYYAGKSGDTTIRAGQTVSGLLKGTGKSLADIQKLNPGVNLNRIRAGAKLNFGVKPPSRPADLNTNRSDTSQNSSGGNRLPSMTTNPNDERARSVQPRTNAPQGPSTSIGKNDKGSPVQAAGHPADAPVGSAAHQYGHHPITGPHSSVPPTSWPSSSSSSSPSPAPTAPLSMSQDAKAKSLKESAMEVAGFEDAKPKTKSGVTSRFIQDRLMKRYVIEELADQDTQKVLKRVANTKKKAAEAKQASGLTATGQKPSKIIIEPEKPDMLGIR